VGRSTLISDLITLETSMPAEPNEAAAYIAFGEQLEALKLHLQLFPHHFSRKKKFF
jgi:hypothetical protein